MKKDGSNNNFRTANALHSFCFSSISYKIVAAHLYKTIDSYLDKHDAQIMDLIKWAKENEN